MDTQFFVEKGFNINIRGNFLAIEVDLYSSDGTECKFAHVRFMIKNRRNSSKEQLYTVEKDEQNKISKYLEIEYNGKGYQLLSKEQFQKALLDVDFLTFYITFFDKNNATNTIAASIDEISLVMLRHLLPCYELVDIHLVDPLYAILDKKN